MEVKIKDEEDWDTWIQLSSHKLIKSYLYNIK